jgi:hypothetical protein
MRDRIHSLLSEHPGVCQVEVNELTGSVVVRYDAQQVGSFQLLGLLQQSGLLARISQPAHRTGPSAGVDKASERVGEALAHYAMGRLAAATGLGFLESLLVAAPRVGRGR